MASDEEVDAAVLSTLTVHWAKVAMVAAKAMDRLKVPISDADMFERVCRRVESLVKLGKIDSQGKVSMPRHSEVRLNRMRGDA